MHVRINGYVDIKAKNICNHIFKEYLKVWHIIEEYKQQQLVEKESLYHFKTESFEDKDVNDSKLIADTFPSFFKVYLKLTNHLELLCFMY